MDILPSDCVSDTDSHQMAGTLSGTINGIQLDSVNIYVYHMITEGKAYTAIDQV